MMARPLSISPVCFIYPVHARESLLIFLFPGLSRNAIFSAVNASLKRLEMDYIDLLQIHRFDPNTRPEETMRALDDLVRSGK